MIAKENNCVGCDVCYHCGLRNQTVVKCDGDKCDHYAQYVTEGEVNGDYCDDCLEKILDNIFKDLSLDAKIEALQEYITVKEDK